MFINGSSVVRVALTTFAGNGAFSTERPPQWAASLHSYFSDIIRSSDGGFGGAVYTCIRGMSRLSVQESTFTSNIAHQGGAIYTQECEDGTLIIGSCKFVKNTGYTHAESLLLDGGVSTAHDLFYSGREAHLLNTTFTPFEPGRSVWMSVPAGCQEHPCAFGEACAYNSFSTFCSACPGHTVGRDGRACVPCAASTGPNANRSDCEECSACQVSAYGVCVSCSHETAPNAAADACVACPTNQRVVDGDCVPDDRGVAAEPTPEPASEPAAEDDPATVVPCPAIEPEMTCDSSITAVVASSLVAGAVGAAIATVIANAKLASYNTCSEPQASTCTY